MLIFKRVYKNIRKNPHALEYPSVLQEILGYPIYERTSLLRIRKTRRTSRPRLYTTVQFVLIPGTYL